MDNVELYFKPTCPFCRKVLSYMDARGITVPMHDISASADDKARLVEVGGKAQVPCLFIDGKPLYESDDIIAWFEAHK
jgi:glutaredoxin